MRLHSAVCSLLLLAGPLLAQTLPTTMVECEDAARCSTWTFRGNQGTGRWVNGASATLVIQQFDVNRIVIQRTDTTGSQAGLTAVYTGKQTGQRIEGTMTTTWPGHPAATMSWHATLPASFPAQPVAGAGARSSSGAPLPSVQAAPLPQAKPAPAAVPQAPHPAPVEAAPAAAAKAVPEKPGVITGVPEILAMCQDQGGCSNWHFKGKDGKGSWGAGQVADLTVQEFDSKRVVIHRIDPSGPAKGLTATYTGTRDGALIEGTVTWQDAGSPKLGTTSWHALVAPPAPTPATQSKKYADLMQRYFQCEDTGNACDAANPPTKYLWSLKGTQGKSLSLSSLGTTIELTEDETPSLGTITYYRKDLNGGSQGLIGMYTGTSNDDGSITRGTLIFFFPGWGKPLKGKWVATRAPADCTHLPKDLSTAQSEMNIGMLATMRNDAPATFHCYLNAAQQGDAEAENEVGLMYIEGKGTTKNTDEAIQWFSKSGDQSNKMALNNLSWIFHKGIGVPVDSLKAAYFEDLGRERQRQVDLSAKIIQPGLGGLGVLFGMLAGVSPVDTSKDPYLDFRLTHEGTVITKMNAGMSRVKAEEATYAEESKERKDNHFECNVKDMFFGSDGPTKEQFETDQHFRERKSGYERHLQDHPACPTGEDDAIEAKNQEYLSCVHRVVDSEKIQASCHLY